jgi:general nucleoside transport system permease protein
MIQFPKARPVIVVAVLSFALICLVAAALQGPSQVPSALATFAQGVAGSTISLGTTVQVLTPILFIATAALIVFRSGVADIGQDGQFVLGGCAAGSMAPLLHGPGVLVAAEVLAVGAAAGAVWATAVHLFSRAIAMEILVVSLISNYLAEALATLVTSTLAEAPNGYDVVETRAVPGQAWLPILLPRTTMHLGVIFALVVLAVTVFVMRCTAVGHRLAMVGKNPRASSLWGSRCSAVRLRANALSGAICGFAGADEVLGVYHRYLDGALGGSDGVAWTGLTVAILVPAGVAAVLPVSLGMAALTSGFIELQIQLGISTGLGTALEGAIIIAAAFAIRAKRQRGRRRPAGRPTATVAKPGLPSVPLPAKVLERSA